MSYHTTDALVGCFIFQYVSFCEEDSVGGLEAAAGKMIQADPNFGGYVYMSIYVGECRELGAVAQCWNIHVFKMFRKPVWNFLRPQDIHYLQFLNFFFSCFVCQKNQ